MQLWCPAPHHRWSSWYFAKLRFPGTTACRSCHCFSEAFRPFSRGCQPNDTARAPADTCHWWEKTVNCSHFEPSSITQQNQSARACCHAQWVPLFYCRMADTPRGRWQIRRRLDNNTEECGAFVACVRWHTLAQVTLFFSTTWFALSINIFGCKTHAFRRPGGAICKHRLLMGLINSREYPY